VARWEERVRWFRRVARSDEEAPTPAAAPAAEESQAEELAEDDRKEESGPDASAEGADSAEPKKPRRRGTRGGRSRKKQDPAAEGAAGATGRVEEPPAATKPKTPARSRRRAATPRRSSLPAVRKEMLISHDVGEQRVAIVEDGSPVEVYLERPGRRSIAGNVYKGIVDNVLPGMEASFVDIGLEKNGFLYVDEIVVPELEGKRHGRRIQDLVSKGQEVLVQAVKDPMGTKGARLTTEISLPGRFLVYVPFGDGIGVSRRLEDEERERLKALCKGLEVTEGGIIVRTAAEGASEEELTGDLAFLQKLWSTIQGRAVRAQPPTLVYREAELPLRVVRDLFLRDFERLAVDHDRTYRRVVSYLKRTSPELAQKVEWYRETEPLMERSGVDAAVHSTLHRRVDLPSGGYLVFDYAEAFTVIDVNTGRFVGARGKSSGARLEDTITKNNLEAAKEIVRQLRLRDIGGIIVIDFIDMANPKNRQEVEEALKRELERDRTKTYVVEISPLGLVEMTRQNVTDGPREILTTRCQICDGDGIVVSEETYAVDAERRLRRHVAKSRAEAFLVELPSRVAGILIGPAGSRLAEIERETGKVFAFETSDDLAPAHFEVLAEGVAADIELRALPVTPGDVLELKLVEPHLLQPEDAIARLDGYVVSVAGGAARIGKKVPVRIERATRTVAYAAIAQAGEVEAPVEAGVLVEEDADDVPVPKKRTRRGTRGGRGRARTAQAAAAVGEEAAPPESEPAAVAEEEPKPAPKPRARRGTRGGAGRSKAKAVLAATNGEEPTLEEPTSAPEPAESEGVADAAEPRPKAKTRRGTRGGRGRKKPAAAVDGAEPTAGTSVDGEAHAAPADETGTAEATNGEAPPKRKTRRGTRGGKGRRKAVAATTDAADEPVPEPAPAAD
jgi:ribonuclease G